MCCPALRCVLFDVCCVMCVCCLCLLFDCCCFVACLKKMFFVARCLWFVVRCWFVGRSLFALGCGLLFVRCLLSVVC